MTPEYLAFVALAFCASFISAVFGLGTALIVLALGAHILPIKETVALATVLFTASTVTKTLLFAQRIDWQIAVTMAVASMPFAFVGGVLLSILDGELLRRALGAMVLLYLVLSLTERLPNFTLSTRGLLLGSAAYGFVSGLLGSGNLIKAIVLREVNVTKEAFVGVMAATSVLANVAKLTAYSTSGILTLHHAVPAGALIVCAIVAALIGRNWLRRIPDRVFSTGVKVILAVSAVGLLF